MERDLLKGGICLFGIKFKNIIFILIGSAIFGFGIVHFNMQNNLAEGGFTGIILILDHFGLNISIMNLVLNIPVFIIGWKLLGRNTLIYSIIGTFAVSFFLWIFQVYMIEIDLRNDMTLASLFAGVFIGLGLGIIFRSGGTTGGVDIIARLVNKYFGVSMGRTMFLFDTAVIAAAVLFYLDHIEGMYTLVAVFVGARVIDFIVEGSYAARGATIISHESQAISAKIMKEMDRGVTVLAGKGSFTGERRDVLYCVVGRNEIIRLKNIINSVDPHAFVAVTSVHDVLGEGFTLDENKNPIEK
ncbi:DUF2179 domain-containing protein [Pontibacillus yanchengensis]|uniref:DUF2179 domain-containing protein n=2 Tax=Pontibacillus yanchengensis TaxID=462910 RepID=A0ACC7VLR8_9BACI|nr:YitT family protein [Pontibacillus yanchengensis]MYL32765.1 DUF2179 domain-containing protein [Pontibacillus yanchengensis]MYL55159.1 DUF2179 domain-containing protein [Pontibacillus yanchengensis]